MAHLYLDESLQHAQPSPAVGAHHELTGPEARHAVQVARVRVGEALQLADGAGLRLRGTVIEVGPGALTLRVDAVQREDEPLPRLVLVQALAKGDRDELAVQAATELGVAEVVPWQAGRSVSRWSGPKLARGVERWRSICREASKQAMRARTPLVHELVTTAELASRTARPRTAAVVLDPWGEEGVGAVGDELARAAGGASAPGVTEPIEELLVIVGPEGGIEPTELSRLVAAGARRVRLGSLILRTSSAGPAMLAILNERLGRFA